MDTKARIEKVLKEEVLPMLQEHGGGARLESYEDGVVWIEMMGACIGCPSADLVTRVAIENMIQKAVPEVERVEVTQMIDPELLAFAEKIFGHKE